MNMRIAASILLLAIPAAGQTAPPASSNDATPRGSSGEQRKEAGIEDVELLELDIPEVVTATRHKESLTSVPHAISVITQEDIRKSGARTVPDALRLIPGMDVAELSGGNAAVAPRGIHGFLSNQTLVLIDSRQVFDSLFGGTLWGSWPISLEDIERIEVVRGPGGVAWGANAVNGVINIITKDPADQLGLTTTSGGGSQGWWKEHLGYAFKDGALRMRVSGEYEALDGYKRSRSILGNADDELKAGRMNVRGIYDLGPKDELGFSAGSSVVDGNYPRPPLGGFGVSRNAGSQANFASAKWTHKYTEDNYFELNGYINDFTVSPGLKAIDYRYEQIAVQLSHTFKPTDNHTLSWGVDSRADILDTSNSDPQMLKEQFVGTAILGLYVQDEWRFAPRWSLNLGGRIDYEFYGGLQPSARAALAYEVTKDSTLWGAVSRAFHMPAAGSRFLDLPLLNGMAIIDADRNIRPETLIAYEAGYRQMFLEKRVSTAINIFWNEYDRLATISPGFGPPGLLNYHFDNKADASTHGVELEAKYAVTDRWTLLGNYTYEGMNWRSKDKIQDKDIMSIPPHKFMVGTRYSLTDDLNLASHLYYVDEVIAPNTDFPFIAKSINPYFRWDMRAEHEFWKKRAALAVGVRNLLDSGHPEGGTLFINSTEVPRMVYAEVRLRLE